MGVGRHKKLQGRDLEQGYIKQTSFRPYSSGWRGEKGGGDGDGVLVQKFDIAMALNGGRVVGMKMVTRKLTFWLLCVQPGDRGPQGGCWCRVGPVRYM